MSRPWEKTYPKEIPLRLEYPQIHTYELFSKSAESFPQNTSILFFNKKFSYAELEEKISIFASYLQKNGIKKGDRVALMLPNCPQFIISYYAVLRIGGIVVAFNPLYEAKEISFQIEDSGARTFITLDIFFEKIYSYENLKNIIIASIADYLPFPLNVLYLFKERGKLRALKRKRGGFRHFKEILKAPPQKPDSVEINPEKDLALLQYSGGTTGIPKGVMLTHKNIIANTLQCRNWFARAERGNEIFLSILPFFHAMGMTTSLNLPVYLGATMVVYPKFDPQKVLGLIDAHRPTLFTGVPAMYQSLTNNFTKGRWDISSIKFCISGAAPLPGEVARDFEKITGATLVEGYGLSEASPVTHCNPLYGKRKNGSCGIPLPDTDCMISGEDTLREIPFNEAGNLMVKGPQVMTGYWNNSDENSQPITDGWLSTGDIARMDEEGYLFIMDRKKDMIISGGYNIFPREIEEVLYTHEKVKEAAVIGIPDKKFGERPKAFIVPKENMELSESEIIDFLKARIARFKIPKKVEFRETLPKTLIGKVLKKNLRTSSD